MPSMFKKAMLYLGLGSDEDFEALDREALPDAVAHSGTANPPEAGPSATRVLPPEDPGTPAPVRPTPARPVGERAPERGVASAVRPIPADEVPEERRRPGVVRTIPAPRNAKPIVVSPVSFNDAQEVADAFKSKQPVIVNLQQSEKELTRRLIDFAAGLCYGVGGDMKKVADDVYMLTPSDVEVSSEERERLQEAGLHD